MPKPADRIPHAELVQRLKYDPETGHFTATEVGQHAALRAGMRAGTTGAAGYRVIWIKGKIYREHNVAWFYVHQEWPPEFIDHINGIRDDNRIANLRLATHQQNIYNRKRPIRNTSGYKGVSWCKKQGKWHVQVKANYKTFNIGYFDDRHEGHEAYKLAAERLHGEFARPE